MTTADDSLDSGMKGTRVLVILDVRNITSEQNRTYCNTRIDYARLRAQAIGDDVPVATIAVDSLVEVRGKDTAATFHREVEAAGFSLSLLPVDPKKGKQQGVDMRIGLLAQASAMNGECDRVVLISGDGDFNVLVEELHRHNVQVDVFAFGHSLDRDLGDLADNVILLDSLPVMRMHQAALAEAVQ